MKSTNCCSVSLGWIWVKMLFRQEESITPNSNGHWWLIAGKSYSSEWDKGSRCLFSQLEALHPAVRQYRLLTQLDNIKHCREFLRIHRPDVGQAPTKLPRVLSPSHISPLSRPAAKVQEQKNVQLTLPSTWKCHVNIRLLSILLDNSIYLFF